MKFNVIFRNGKSKIVDTNVIGNVETTISLNNEMGYKVALANVTGKLDLRLMKVYDELMTIYGEPIDPLDVNIIKELQIMNDDNEIVGNYYDCTVMYNFTEKRMDEILFFDKRPSISKDISL